jgi:hypothetical protein
MDAARGSRPAGRLLLPVLARFFGRDAVFDFEAFEPLFPFLAAIGVPPERGGGSELAANLNIWGTQGSTMPVLYTWTAVFVSTQSLADRPVPQRAASG